MRVRLLGLIGFLCVSLAASPARDAAQISSREIENLAAFAQVYGVVRFFCPSEAAKTTDWNRLAIYGVDTVRIAKDDDQLRHSLEALFEPLAPGLSLSAQKPAPAEAKPSSGVFWQYLGVKLSDQPSPYRQKRVTVQDGQSTDALFPPAELPGAYQAQLSSNLFISLPLTTALEQPDRLGPLSPKLASLRETLAAIDPNALDTSDWRLRVTGVITVWSVFQHFHPYLNLLGIRWNETLRPALNRALRDSTGEDYAFTLSELIAQTRDGHGFVYGSREKVGGLPLRADLIEGRVVITGLQGDSPLRKGDIIEKIDGVSALEILAERERYAPGSPHLSRHRALNQFGQGPLNTVAHLALRRDDREITVDCARIPETRGYFFNSISEFEFPPFAEIRPGIYYVNLLGLDATLFEEKLPQLAEARGIIFDWRSDGRRPANAEKFKMIEPHRDIIPHLIDQRIQASPMLVPRIVRPDRVGWSYQEATWPVEPKAPRFKGKSVFINLPSVVSYGETCMAMIADYKLAALVGEPTAGCNGNVNFIPLPGGFRVMWTGMDVRKHDHSAFYNAGFLPDFPVTRTLRAVREGRDEFLDRAIAVIE